jgi:hypothetical protein
VTPIFTVCQGVNWLNPGKINPWVLVTAAGSKGLLTRCDLQGNPPSDIPFGCNGSYMVWFIYWKTQLTEMKGVVRSCTKYSRVGSKPMLSKAFLTGYMERTCLQIFLGDGP